MRLPTEMPGVGRLVYQPVFAFESLNDSISPQGPFDFIPGIGGGLRTAQCAACCSGKAGFVACVARCVATGQACDGGVDNCSPC
jgi:hypothetical protein